MAEEKKYKYQEMPTEERRRMEARLMLYMEKMGVKEIADYTGLSIEEVEAIQAEEEANPTMEKMFKEHAAQNDTLRK